MKEQSRVRDIRFATADGFKLSGDAELLATENGLVVFFHGLTETRSEYANFYDGLIQRLRLIDCGYARIDHRGHGRSQGKDLDVGIISAFLDADGLFRYLLASNTLDKRDITVLGTSYGANAAIKFAALSTARKLVLVAPALDLEAVLLQGRTTTARAFYDPTKDPQLFKQGYLNFSDSFRISARFVEEMRWIKLAPRLANLSSTVSIVHGDKDDVVPVDISIAAARANPRIQLHVMAGMDHGHIDVDDPSGTGVASKRNLDFIFQVLTQRD